MDTQKKIFLTLATVGNQTISQKKLSIKSLLYFGHHTFSLELHDGAKIGRALIH
jgi:hypothetical protein